MSERQASSCSYEYVCRDKPVFLMVMALCTLIQYHYQEVIGMVTNIRRVLRGVYVSVAEKMCLSILLRIPIIL